MYRHTRRVLMTGLSMAWAACAGAATVNFDFGERGNYRGDNGVLSSPAGNQWNDVQNGEDGLNLVDEFFQPTTITFSLSPESIPVDDRDATNSLQEDGLTNAVFTIEGLDRNTLYDIAVYTYQLEGVVVNPDRRQLESPRVLPTYALPGTELVGTAGPGDYYLFRGVQAIGGRASPVTIQVSSGNGQAITGLQIREVPEPATGLVLFSTWVLGARPRPN